MDSRAIITELPRLRRYARAMIGDRAAADDLVQDTLERAWSRIAQWRAGSDLRAWLFGIMHNLRVDQLRRGTLTTHSLDDDACDVPTRATQSDRLEVMDLESALRQLPDDQREAAALGIPIGTVMSRLSRGRERLRQIMEGQKPSANLRVVR